MHLLPLLAEFNLLKPDLGLLFWSVVAVLVLGLAAIGYLAFRLLRSDH